MSMPPPGPPQPPYGPYGPYQPDPQQYPQQYPAPPPYPGYQPYPVKPPMSAWAVVSLVFGLLGGVLVSVVCGIVALTKTKNNQQSGRGLAIAGLVLSALWTVGIVAVVALVAFADKDGSSVRPTSLAVGDCLTEIPDSYRVLRIDTVDCAQPHLGEVYANIDIPGDDFPNSTRLEAYQDECSPALEEFSPEAMIDESIGLFVLYPTEDTWKAGDRTVTCIATSESPLTGSLGD